ncbi:MAG: glycosyltransferase [Oligoflexia bacterium]|nr:glycosyltransferase [Oligoflexia bacterium]
MSSPVSVSALIVSYQRDEWLERCVRSLVFAADSNSFSFEISVVINGPDPKSWDKARALRDSFRGCPIEVIRLEMTETPARARNLALSSLSRVKAEKWILFIDDDAFVEPDFFARFTGVLLAFPDAGAIGGPNLTPPGSSVFQRATGEVLSSRLGCFDSYTRYRPVGAARRATERDLILCNLFVRGELLSGSSFPCDFKCAEENWLIQTLVSRGYQVIYDPVLRVWHERRPGFITLGRQVLKYGYGRGQNVFRRPRSARAPHLVPSGAVLAGIVLCLLASLVPSAARLLGVLTVLYFALIFCWAGRNTGSFSTWMLKASLFPVIHVCYGIGVLTGLSCELYAACLRFLRRLGLRSVRDGRI